MSWARRNREGRPAQPSLSTFRRPLRRCTETLIGTLTEARDTYHASPASG